MSMSTGRYMANSRQSPRRNSVGQSWRWRLFRSCLALAVFAQIASRYELARGLADSCPSIFSIETGNDRTRVPVA